MVSYLSNGPVTEHAKRGPLVNVATGLWLSGKDFLRAVSTVGLLCLQLMYFVVIPILALIGSETL